MGRDFRPHVQLSARGLDRAGQGERGIVSQPRPHSPQERLCGRPLASTRPAPNRDAVPPLGPPPEPGGEQLEAPGPGFSGLRRPALQDTVTFSAETSPPQASSGTSFRSRPPQPSAQIGPRPREARGQVMGVGKVGERGSSGLEAPPLLILCEACVTTEEPREVPQPSGFSAFESRGSGGGKGGTCSRELFLPPAPIPQPADSPGPPVISLRQF